MPSPTSPNMGLYEPIPGSTAGPQWATELTANMAAIDLHDHTPGKGVQIPVAALTVNADFSWLTYGQTNIGYAAFVDKLLTANLTVNGSIGNVAGVPYWRNAVGVVSQLIRASDVFTSSAAGIVPASGGGTANFLRADGTWAAAGGTPTVAANSVLGNNTGSPAPAASLAATAAGLAILGAASASAQRTLLGIDDLTSFDNNELAHANQVCSFTYPSLAIKFESLAKPATIGSKWGLIATGSGAASVLTSGVRGGGIQLTTGATASSQCNMIGVQNGLGIFGGSFMDDLVAATSKFHMQVAFKMATAIDAVTQTGIGWINSAGSATLCLGVRGASGTTYFRLYNQAGTGANSTIAIDTNWHLFRMWGNGDTKVYFAVDNETPIAVSGLTWGTGASPFLELYNQGTAAARTVYLGPAIYRADGMVA